ncbi:PBSX family phage terminase large subunit [Mucilaginibacter paludis]|uniref:Phage terminase, large subunit, PBSX family n=1 Tax=Mucilaginibacter paludis DSM 18603 TaxID=714943 RepID=H1Y7Q3_9SPHI|nr:PBSX family phage terminase large subunit [Mucilaginibacter paludis]EHQ29898.1 phage terminase, large subunit, PBSX family [Mucilaginibacter paludis DSM 18603]
MNEIKITFNPNLFNNVYWHLLKAFDDNQIRFIWVYGGSSASKTYSVVQLTLVRMLEQTNQNTFVLRKYGVDIRDSIYSDFKNLIADWGLGAYFSIQQNYILCKASGSYIRFRGLDDSEKIKGISNFKKVILEEVSQFDEVDYKQIRKRLRGQLGQQIIGIFNPVSEDHWIKNHIFDQEVLQPIESNISGMWRNEPGNLLILKTNYLDNRYIVGPQFVDQHAIADFERDKISDYNYYQIYGLGNWGKLRTGGEFWKDFNASRNSARVNWNEALPLHLSWDENVNPYLTCLVWQIEGKTATQIDEICLEDPRNRVHHVCAEFASRYPPARVKGLYIYGDRTSIKQDTKLEKGENFFTRILQLLQPYAPTLRMQSANPSIVQSAGFINQIYAGRIPGLQIIIGENCRRSLHDYQYAIEDSDGTLKKTKKQHPLTKVSYEEFGHPSDAKRYLLTQAFATEYQAYLKGDKKIQIRTGKPLHKHGY